MNLTRRSRRLTALLVAAVMLFAGCAASGDDATEAEAPAVATADEESTDAAGSGNEAGADDAGGGEAVADPPVGIGTGEDDGRLLRREAVVRIEVTDLVAATDDAIASVTDAGGYLGSQRSTPTSSELVLRVPSGEFDATLTAITSLGALFEQTVTTDDRTEVIIDLEARLATAQASLERTRSFFEQARTVTDLTTLEGELTIREAQVASLQADLDNERSAVALSTITVSLFLESGIEPVDVVDDDALPGVSDALSSGWNAIVATGYIMVLVGAYLLPWLVPLLLVGLGVRSLIRRRRARRPATVTTPPPAPLPTPPPLTSQPPPPGPAAPATDPAADTTRGTDPDPAPDPDAGRSAPDGRPAHPAPPPAEPLGDDRHEPSD